MARVIRAQRIGPAVLPAALRSAQLEAAEIRARAQIEAEDIRQKAHREGFAAGQAEAARQLIALTRAQAELNQRTERDATQAALLIAGQLLGSALQAEPDKIVALLRPHLARMRRAQRLMLRLHPEDAAYFEREPEALAELSEQQLCGGSLELRRDPGITRGGCVLESNIGELDARVETRLSLLAAALSLPVPKPEDGSA